MKRITELIAVFLLFGLMLTAAMSAVAMEGESDSNDGHEGAEPEDHGDEMDPDDDDERPNEPEDHLGNGVHSVRTLVIDNISSEPVSGVNLYGWSESPDNSRDPQKVYGITDVNGTVIFRLDPGKFHFNVEVKDYLMMSFILEVEGPMNHTVKLMPYPATSATVEGVVKDSSTGEPIKDVMISFYLRKSPLFPEQPGDPEEPPIDEKPEDGVVEDDDAEGRGDEGGDAGGEGGEQDERKEDETEPSVPEPTLGYRMPFIMVGARSDENGMYSVKLIPGTYGVNVYPVEYRPDPDEDLVEPKKPPEERPGEDDGNDNTGDVGSDERSGEVRGDGGDDKVPAEYYSFYDVITVDVNETLAYDVLLEPLPPMNSMVKGYVTDEDGNPIPDASIYVYPEEPEKPGEDRPKDEGGDADEPEKEDSSEGSDDVEIGYYPGHYNDNYGRTDELGYYEVRLRAGHYSMLVSPPYHYGSDDGWENDDEVLPGDDGHEENEVEAREEEGKRGGGEGDEGTPGGGSATDEDDGMEEERKEEERKEEEKKKARPEDDHWYGMERRLNFRVGPNEDRWMNVTLKNPPKKDSRIIGKVLDRETGEAITNAEISVYGGERFIYVAVDTGEDGGFSVDVYPGYYYIDVRVYEDLYLSPEEYDEKYGDGDGDVKAEEVGGMYKVRTPYFPYSTELKVESNETAELEVLLKPKPKDLVEIEGFVRDADTSAVVTYYPVEVTIITDEYVLHNSTWTDETGHYSIEVPLGDIILKVGGDMHKYRRPLCDEMGGTAGTEKSDDDYEVKDYFPIRYTTKAAEPGKINKDFELEERVYPEGDTLRAELTGGSGDDYNHVELYVFDVGRGIRYQDYGYNNDDNDHSEKEKTTRSGDMDIGMGLPDGDYKVFALEYSGGEIVGLTDVADLSVTDGTPGSLSLDFEEPPENGAKMSVDFVSKNRIKVRSEMTLGGPGLTMKAMLESDVGNGDMVISADERTLLERYASIEGDPIIKPVLSLGGTNFVIDTDSVLYSLPDSLVGAIDATPLTVTVTFEMEAVGTVDLEKGADFDFNIKGPFAMEVDCEIRLPDEMKLEDGTHTVSKAITIKPGNVWRDGLSDDFQEEADNYVPKAAPGDDTGGDDWTGAGGNGDGDLGSDEGLSLTFFEAGKDESRGGEVSQTTYVILGAVVLVMLVVIGLFVALKGKKRSEEKEEEEEETG